MSIWTLVKLFAGLVVLAVMLVSGMVAYHVAVKPLPVLSEVIPPPAQTASGVSDEELAKMLDSPEMPDIDPGEKTYQKAQELLAMGKLPEAREKLTAIVNVFPSSSSASAARRIVGEMNLDELLSSTNKRGKKIHVVKRGEALLTIASQNQTTIESMVCLNSLLELRGIQPGDEFVVMPLDFRILIEPRRKSLSIWEGGKFIKEYPLLRVPSSTGAGLKTKIASKSAEHEGKKVVCPSKFYSVAAKSILLAKPGLQIRSWDGVDDKAPAGILVKPQDMEEINMLTRVGNEVEFR